MCECESLCTSLIDSVDKMPLHKKYIVMFFLQYESLGDEINILLRKSIGTIITLKWFLASVSLYVPR